MVIANPGQPTLNDVARQAGVSPATVSRVLNNTAPVAEATRSRVMEAIQLLGYDVGVSPREASSEGAIIALLITDILNPFFPEIVRGVQEESMFSRFSLMLFNTSEDPSRERFALEMAAEHRVAGLIACASRMDPHDLIAFHTRHRTPVVVINRRLNYDSIPCITIDFANATYRATQHLVSLGHTRIAYLAGYGASETSQARRHGIESALTEYGLTLNPAWCPSSFPGVEGGFQAMSNLLATSDSTDRPTAVIAYNDVMALGALNAIRTVGLSVPDDISVIGFDGITMAAHANPPLTTIDQPKAQMGKLAVQVLRRMLMGEVVPGNGYTLLESPLIVRESTGVAPTG